MQAEFQTPDQLLAHYAAVRARLCRPVAIKTRKPVQPAYRERTVWDERICYVAPIGPVKPASPQTVPGSPDDLVIPTVTGREILYQVAIRHGVPMNEIVSPRREQRLARIRFEIFYRLKTETTLSFPQMGRLMRRDHTTALHGYRRFADMLKTGEVTL